MPRKLVKSCCLSFSHAEELSEAILEFFVEALKKIV